MRMEYPNKMDVYCKGQPMPELKLAEAYVKDQPYVGMVTLTEGFSRGSIFPNLYDPYYMYDKKPCPCKDLCEY